MVLDGGIGGKEMGLNLELPLMADVNKIVPEST